ncbi:MAG: YHS domain-containing protein [Pseudomonadota bacterium]
MSQSINKYCPRSGKRVVDDSLTDYRGQTVGFCNPGCRDDFAQKHRQDDPQSNRDQKYFDVIIKEQGLV